MSGQQRCGQKPPPEWSSHIHTHIYIIGFSFCIKVTPQLSIKCCIPKCDHYTSTALRIYKVPKLCNIVLIFSTMKEYHGINYPILAIKGTFE